MAKSRKRLDELSNRPPLLALLEQEAKERNSEPGEGSFNINNRLKTALSHALKQASTKSRWEIAGEMSHLLGLEISKYMIDSWVANSKGHKIPGEYIPAFCVATGNLAPLHVLNDTCKVFTVKGPDAIRAEIQRDEEAIKLKRQEKKKKEVLLAVLETKQGGLF